jgi:hypothetical protein
MLDLVPNTLNFMSANRYSKRDVENPLSGGLVDPGAPSSHLMNFFNQCCIECTDIFFRMKVQGNGYPLSSLKLEEGTDTESDIAHTGSCSPDMIEETIRCVTPGQAERAEEGDMCLTGFARTNRNVVGKGPDQGYDIRVRDSGNDQVSRGFAAPDTPLSSGTFTPFPHIISEKPSPCGHKYLRYGVSMQYPCIGYLPGNCR